MDLDPEDLEDAYEITRASQLKNVNERNALLFSRDKNSVSLARKLRPEFNKLWISSEFKDCQKLVNKVDNLHMEISGVDVVSFFLLNPLNMNIFSKICYPLIANC